VSDRRFVFSVALGLACVACGGLEEAEDGAGLVAEVFVAEDAAEQLELVTVVADEPIADSDLPSAEGEAIAEAAEDLDDAADAADADAPPPDIAEVEACSSDWTEPDPGDEALPAEETVLSGEAAPGDALGPADDAGVDGTDSEPAPSDEPDEPAPEEPSSIEPEGEAAEILPS